MFMGGPLLGKNIFPKTMNISSLGIKVRDRSLLTSSKTTLDVDLLFNKGD